MKKLITLTILISCLPARAEFGMSAGASFNYKANFRNATAAQGLVNDPGGAVDGVNHFYDDGYNRVDSSGNFDNQTTYWGYQNAEQYDSAGNGKITMSSVQSIIDSQTSYGKQTEAQPAIEIYWQSDFTGNERWNLGFRTALRWQRINLDSCVVYNTISDTYSLAGSISPGAPYSGTYTGPGVLLSDIPVRSINDIVGSRDIDADIFAVDFGPTLSFDFTGKLRLTTSAGGTVAWIDSDFSYCDGDFAEGKESDDAWLLGAYAAADLSYLISERWGIFGGAAYTVLENFDQKVDGRSAQLQFGDSYTVRTGLFFQ